MYIPYSLQGSFGSTPYYIIYSCKTIRNHSSNVNNPSDFSLFPFPFSLIIRRILHFSLFTFHLLSIGFFTFPFSLFTYYPSDFQKESFWLAKRVLLMSKTSPFGEQNESFWSAKGVLLKNGGYNSVLLTRKC